MTESEFQQTVQAAIDAAVTQGDRTKSQHVADVLNGDAKAFYSPGLSNSFRGGYDNEQYLAIFEAVHTATSMPGATDAQRWKVVEAKLAELADEFATWAVEQ